MTQHDHQRCIAFAGPRRIAAGELADVAIAVKQALDGGENEPVLVFDPATSQPIELDLRGSAEEIRRRLAHATQHPHTENEHAHTQSEAGPQHAARGRGRPKLGVVAREITLLPRHWEWLNAQPGGASVALRKLVDEARRANEGKDRARRAEESAYRFMSAMAGNQADFEEAMRAFFSANAERFHALTEHWPADVRDHARLLASAAFDARADALHASHDATSPEHAA